MEKRGSAEKQRTSPSPGCAYLPPLTPQSRTTCQQSTDDRRPCQRQAPAATPAVTTAGGGASQHTPTAKTHTGGVGTEHHGSKHASNKSSSTKPTQNQARRKRKKRKEVSKCRAQQVGLDPGMQALQQQLSDLDTGCAYRQLSTVPAYRVSQFPFPRSHNPVAMPSVDVNDREPYLRHAWTEATQLAVATANDRRTIATPDSLDSGVGSADHISPSARSGSRSEVQPPADSSIPWTRAEMYATFSEHDEHDSAALLEYREERRKRYQDVQSHRHGSHQQDIQQREDQRLRTRTVHRTGYGKPCHDASATYAPPTGASPGYKAGGTVAVPRTTERCTAALSQGARSHAETLRMPTAVSAKA